MSEFDVVRDFMGGFSEAQRRPILAALSRIEARTLEAEAVLARFKEEYEKHTPLGAHRERIAELMAENERLRERVNIAWKVEEADQATIARLRRIEEAAGTFICWLEGGGNLHDDGIETLRAALQGSEGS